MGDVYPTGPLMRNLSEPEGIFNFPEYVGGASLGNLRNPAKSDGIIKFPKEPRGAQRNPGGGLRSPAESVVGVSKNPNEFGTSKNSLGAFGPPWGVPQDP